MVRGRLVWVVDAYLASQRFPLAQRVRWHGDDVNYLAASYVVTVDATSGRTQMFLRGPGQEFAAALARSEGATVLPQDSLDPELRRQLVYPSGLFGAQVAVLAKRGEAGVRWAEGEADTAAGRDVGMLRATVALLALDGADRKVWSLAPLTDAGGDHTVAVLAGSSAADGSLSLRVLRPGGELPTPQAAAARIGGAPMYLASTAAMPGQVRRGSVLVVPVLGRLVFLQAVFTGADPSAAPELAGLAVLADGRVGFGADVPAAVRSLVRGDLPALPGGAGALADARAAFLALDSARQRADWEAFGRAWTALRRSLGLEVRARRLP